MKRLGLLMMVTVFSLVYCLFGCASAPKSKPQVRSAKAPLSDQASPALAKCLAAGGSVLTESYPDGTSAQLCVTGETSVFDDGMQQMTHRCLLDKFYYDTCDADALPDTQRPAANVSDTNALNAYFHQTVLDIMTKVKNTGYAHNKNHNFSLVPEYTDITRPQAEYDLFLDCSGFVGYYVIQGLAPGLYQAAQPSRYACQDRPLAADFADLISKAPQVDDDHPTATKDDIAGNHVCWGQVMQAKDIQPGDVIVYKHPENIRKSKKECTDKRKVWEVKGNTGHILFAHNISAESRRCKENSFSCGTKQYLLAGDWQRVVSVADSTTSRHLGDSRQTGIGKSDYQGHFYTAWEKGTTKGCVVERCANGSYHRSCIANGSQAVEFVEINTAHPNNPTGIGVGSMYIGPSLKSYRSSYTADSYEYKNDKGEKEQVVFIGRPVKCGKP
ncbi:MAG: hypothetical protein HPY65_10910 [Syntrophaceae bacterium]|nr:hypothetical protein [Syntrophaceae bacterium]